MDGGKKLIGEPEMGRREDTSDHFAGFEGGILDDSEDERNRIGIIRFRVCPTW